MEIIIEIQKDATLFHSLLNDDTVMVDTTSVHIGSDTSSIPAGMRAAKTTNGMNYSFTKTA